jgi:bisphosphoglycerate-independent phosphoglycerate mutase (AlkP superfamily)
MGNSEVGHLNIGAGRIVHMDITRIDLMIQNGEFFSHPVLVEAMKNARTAAASCICSACCPTAACIRGRSIFMRS